MLVVTRKDRESVRIGEDILVTVWRTNDGRIRVGIEAPKNLRVERVGRSAPRAAVAVKDDRHG